MKVDWHINGDTQLILTPETEKDWKLLEIAGTGTVKEVRKPVKGSEERECFIIVFAEDK